MPVVVWYNNNNMRKPIVIRTENFAGNEEI